MKYVTGFCLLILTLAPAAWGADADLFPPEMLARIRRGIQDIYNMEYARAAENFRGMIEADVDDPTGYTYLAMTYWVEELASKQELSIDRFAASDFFAETPKYRPEVDPAAENRFRETNRQAIQKARSRLERNPEDWAALFVRGLAYQNLASFEAALKRNWWASFRAGTKTFRDHRELLRRDPEFHDARLSVGVYDYVAGSLNWSVKWLAYLLGYVGNKERGRELLETAAAKGELAADDARTMLILIYTREKNYEKALRYLSELQDKYPQNCLVPLDMAGIALLMGEHDKAIANYQEILHSAGKGERRFSELERASLYNRLGVAFRKKGDLAASVKWFEEALRQSPLSARSETVARLELAKVLDLLNRRAEAQENYRAVLIAPDVAGSREEAAELLRRPYRE